MAKTISMRRLGLGAVAAALLLAGCGKQSTEAINPASTAANQAKTPAVPAAAEAAPATKAKPIPRLLDLGAHSCIPCKMMAPILAELTTEYAGRMKVEFIDVWQNAAAGKEHGVQSIPTQIFYGADGKELFRHVGFLAKADILAKWQELGYSFTPPEGAK